MIGVGRTTERSVVVRYNVNLISESYEDNGKTANSSISTTLPGVATAVTEKPSNKYTVGHKKVPLYFYDNFSKCGPISIILSLLDSQINCGIR